MKSLPLAGLVVTLFVATLQPVFAESWPQEKSDLKPDSQAIWGKLANGLRYIIYPNKHPLPGRASVRLLIDAGSLMENDDQRGMAHFLEHMSFNGSKNFPAGTMVETFQRMGMAFGADTNAHTSFKETVYKLELPKVDEAMLTEGFRLFRDDLNGLLLNQAEIDKERGVILSEKLARDSVDTRMMEESYKFALPESLIPQRMPIGTEETIKAMARPRFVDFYETWYTPERATLVVVGDVDVPLVEKLIKSTFEDAKAGRGEQPDPDLGSVQKGRGLVTKLYTEMEAPAVEVSLGSVTEASKDPDSSAFRRTKMIRRLADAMLNQRFSLLAKAENSPIMEAGSSNFAMFKFVELNDVTAKAAPDKWKPALTLIEQELRRALEFGFTDAEFKEATSDLLKKVKLQASQKETRKNQDLANFIVSSLGQDQVLTDPIEDAARVEKELAGITKEDVLKSLKQSWDTPDRQIFVTGNLQLENASELIAAVYKESALVAVNAPDKQEVAAFAYTEFGKPAKAPIETKTFQDLGITQAAFENNVRLNLKKTDFEKNAIRIRIDFGGGKLVAPANQPGLIQYAQGVFENAGLEKHSADELRRIFADKDVSVDFAVDDGAFVFEAKTTPADLESQMELLAAYFVAPGYREEADRQFKKGLDTLYNKIDHTAEGVVQDQVASYIHSDDFRFGFPAREVLEQRNLSELKAWLTPALQKAYMEISIGGDFDEEKTIAAVAKTFGAFPTREKMRADYSKESKVSFPAPPQTKTYDFTTEIPRAYALAYWPTTDMSDIGRTRRLMMLGQILNDRLRLKIREELGETYSPNSYNNSSDMFTGYGYMSAMASLKPEQVALVEPMFVAIGEGIGKQGITDDEFQRASGPQLQQLTQMRKDNRYWVSRVLQNSQAQPWRLDWARSLVDDFTNIKKEELEALAKEYLQPGKVVQVGVIPKPEVSGN